MKKQCSLCGEFKTEFRKHRTTCKDCGREYARQLYHKKKQGIQGYTEERAIKEKQNRRNNPEYYIYHHAKIRAKKKGIEFNIELEDIIVGDTCPVLGIPLFVMERQGHNSPTLDRIDNTKGYIKGNVEVISWRANNIKSDSNLAEIEKIYLWLKGKT